MKPTDWVWCLHCERAHLYSVWRYEKVDAPWAEILGLAEIEMCPHEGCDGGMGDMWTWARIREANPGYPEIPLPGVVYPLYGEKGSA